MRTRHGFFSHWCSLLEYHLGRLKLSVSEFAPRVGRSQQVVFAYLSGRSRPPLDCLEEWARVLGLSPHDRAAFIQAAYEAHTPEVIWRRLVELEHQTETDALRRADASLVREIERQRTAIAELVALLRRADDLFYSRRVALGKMAEARIRLGADLAAAIARHSVPPETVARPGPAE